MSQRRHILAAGGIVAGAAAFLSGWFWRAHVDTSVNLLARAPGLTASRIGPQDVDESRYFYEVTELLRMTYVDKVEVDAKMSNGAVRGMVQFLLDPDSLYYDKKEFAAFLSSRKGVYEGVGVELSYSFNTSELDKLRDGARGANAYLALPGIKIRAVVPGSSADKAGLRPGDKVLAVNGKWILSGEDLLELRRLQTAVTEGKAKPEALEAVRSRLDKRVKSSVSAAKARDHLLTGTEGKVHLVWERKGQESEASLSLGTTTVEAVSDSADGTVYRLIEGASGKLPVGADEIRLDLRNSGAGSVSEVLPSLDRLVAKGTYGVVVKDPGKTVHTLSVRGTANPPKVVAMVDESTTGAAALLALCLSQAANVTLVGPGPRSAVWTEVFELPFGEGYTLSTGTYAAASGKVVMKK